MSSSKSDVSDDLVSANTQNCHLNSTSTRGGAFTAQRREAPSDDTGYSFVRCRLTGVGVDTSILGRPWGNYSRVVFALSSISNTVNPLGWDDWEKHELQRYGRSRLSTS
jgi:pectinesterase